MSETTDAYLDAIRAWSVATRFVVMRFTDVASDPDLSKEIKSETLSRGIAEAQLPPLPDPPEYLDGEDYLDMAMAIAAVLRLLGDRLYQVADDIAPED